MSSHWDFMSIQWGDVAAWTQGVGTIGAVWVAFWQIRVERRRRMALEERERISARRSQAERVAAWLGEEESSGQHIVLWNVSLLPVYEVVASLVMIQGAGPANGEGTPSDFRVAASPLPTGRWYVTLPVEAGDWRGMSREAGVEVAFTDSAGRHWLRRADGALEEIDTNAVDHYKLERPVQFGRPRPEE